MKFSMGSLSLVWHVNGDKTQIFKCTVERFDWVKKARNKEEDWRKWTEVTEQILKFVLLLLFSWCWTLGGSVSLFHFHSLNICFFFFYAHIKVVQQPQRYTFAQKLIAESTDIATVLGVTNVRTCFLKFRRQWGNWEVFLFYFKKCYIKVKIGFSIFLEKC